MEKTPVRKTKPVTHKASTRNPVDRSSIARNAALARWQREKTQPMPRKKTVRGKIAPELARFLEDYETSHGLTSGTEALEHAVRALQEKELAQAYRDYADDLAAHPDPWVDSDLPESLELIDAAAR
ncbi:MAG: hypothetical protein HC933_20155 [Pleurocapsa sp. SU_196_0]|nr:hypothetical protein [Pleurocapsa sp. SU_196_0]